MNTVQDNDRFWIGDEGFIAVNPHRLQDADGLTEFAASSDVTRSLLFFQTSGSEGVPKWVGLPRSAFLASARAVNAHLAATARDCWLIALPLHHVGGFSILARCHASGAAFVQMGGKWDAAEFAQRTERDGITLASLVPTQVFDLVHAGVGAPRCVRAVVVGGGALSVEIGQRARALGWPVLQSYGMTEACSQVATEPLGHMDSGFDPDALGVLPCWDVRTDAEGRLILRGPALASGYAVKRGDAWQWEPIPASTGLVTRDRVRLHPQGARQILHFIGRESSFVKVLGELVNVADVQARLENVAVSAGLAPDSVAVVPVKDERRETKLILAGELGMERLEGLRQRFNETAAGYERLDEIRAVSQMPRSALGKLNATALKAMLGVE